ncbi:response regulator [Rubrobacter marinus]|uniref:Response regulator n=1 Tax=Rubrobacter marinus TaxID=2653852 RepID=A0A6G8Q2U2_9ACTN|nr:response regulator transcription factor [Rubrobacter marinus]QIN80637.1 response regulator [Rubrobacter marinus]
MTGEKSADEPVRLLLVEDHAAFRQALAFVLSRQPCFEVVAQAGTLDGARAAIGRGIDVALVDLMLPDGNGADLIAELRETNPSVRVLVLSASLGEENLSRAREAGADGVLDKTVSPGEIAETVRRLRSG